MFIRAILKLMVMTQMQSQMRERLSYRCFQLVLAIGLAAGALPHAGAEGIFLCVDADGRRELTDVNRGGCKAIQVPGAISEPIPAPRRASPPAPVRLASVAPRAASASPADFPRVDGAQQKARDNDRRDILNDELRSEERKLADLRKEFNNGEPERQGNERNYAKYQERVANIRDNIGRAEKNIQALRREIASIK
jgi:hypothetical protein